MLQFYQPTRVKKDVGYRSRGLGVGVEKIAVKVIEINAGIDRIIARVAFFCWFFFRYACIASKYTAKVRIQRLVYLPDEKLGANLSAISRQHLIRRSV